MTPDVVETDRAVLEARANALARRGRHVEDKQNVEVVRFALAGETYALELRFLLHVLPLRELAILPGAQPPLLGLAAWRGELLRVLDLAHVLEVPSGPTPRTGKLLVTGRPGSALGLLVDDTGEMATLSPATITLTAGRRFARGITRDAVVVLDGDNLIRELTEATP